MADILHRLNIDAPAETTCLGDYDEWDGTTHVIRDYAEGKSTELPPSGRSS